MKKTYLVFIVLLLVTFVSTVGVNAAPIKYDANGHYYDRISWPGHTWIEAKSAAELQTYGGVNGYLATFTSRQERDFISHSFSNIYTYYIGGYQIPCSPEPDCGWQWVTGEPWGDYSWNLESMNDKYGGQCGPSPNRGENSEEVLVILYNNMWEDYPEDVNSIDFWGGACVPMGGYIVEFEPSVTAPEFPSIFLPAAMIIGFLGAVLFIQRTREH